MPDMPAQTRNEEKPPSPTVTAPPTSSSSSPTPSTPTSAPAPATTKETDTGPLLFHFAECTNCHHILPISTNTEKYFPILSKEPKKAKGLGEKCMRCGADSWVLVVG